MGQPKAGPALIRKCQVLGSANIGAGAVEVPTSVVRASCRSTPQECKIYQISPSVRGNTGSFEVDGAEAGCGEANGGGG